MGRHPFAGRFLGRGDMPIETAIQQYRFAYGSDCKLTQMEPPPHVPALVSVSPGIASLFERAFSRTSTNGHARPTPADWITALDSVANQLARCKREPNHLHVSSSLACPWCEIEGATGALLFNIAVLPTTDVRHFDVVTVWRAIQSIQLSPPAPAPTESDVGSCDPTPEAVRAGKARGWLAFGLKAFTPLLVFCTLGAIIFAPAYWLLWGLVAWGIHSFVEKLPKPPK